jgi:hypothetical protein
MKIGRPGRDSGWLGVAPPDLTNVARVRGDDWIYTLRRPSAVVRLMLAVLITSTSNTAMPNVGRAAKTARLLVARQYLLGKMARFRKTRSLAKS